MHNLQNLEISKLGRQDTVKDLSPHSTICFMSSSIENSEVEIKQNVDIQKKKFQANQIPLENKLCSQAYQGTEGFQQFIVLVEKIKNEGESSEKVSGKIKSLKRTKFEIIYRHYLRENREEEGRNSRKFIHFLQRRPNLSCNQIPEKIDLGVSNLREIIEYMALKDLIPYDLYLNCCYLHCSDTEISFIKYLGSGSLQKFAFERNIYCAFDHRLLCMLLCTYFPSDFSFPSEISTSHQELTEFYNFLYKIPQKQYLKYFEDLRKRFNRHWMPKNSKIQSLLKIEQINSLPKNIFLVINKSRNLRNNIGI